VASRVLEASQGHLSGSRPDCEHDRENDPETGYRDDSMIELRAVLLRPRPPASSRPML
jgi:hypothetical protein